MGKVFKYKLVIIAGLAVVLLYFFLRIYNLTIFPIFADEAIYIRWAQVMKNEPTLRFLPLSDGKQPLFMWMIIPFFRIFDDPLIAGRMVSVMAGFGTLLGVFLLTYYLFKKTWVALVAALFYTISPFTIFFDRMALADSMLSMFGIWVLFWGIMTARTLRLDLAMLSGFTLGGALLTKSPALFYSLLLPVVVLISSIVKLKNWKLSVNYLNVVKFSGLLLVTYVIGYAMYNILRLGPNFTAIGERNQDYVLPLSHIFTDPRDPFIFHIDRAREWLFMLGPFGLVIFALAGLYTGLRRFPKETLIVSLWAIVPIFIQSEFAKVFTARYILFSLAPIAVVSSFVFLEKQKLVKKIAILGAVVLFAHAVFIDYRLIVHLDQSLLPQSERSGYLEEWTAGTGTREISQFVKEYKENYPEKRLVVGTDGFFGTMPDGIQIYIEDIPGITVIGVGITISNVPESLLNAKKSGDTVYLVVNSSRFLGNADDLGLRLINSYPKAKRLETDSREALLYGESDSLLFFEVTEDAL